MEKQQNNSEWQMFLASVLFWIAIIIAVILFNSCTVQPMSAKQAIPEEELYKAQAHKQQKVIEAYSKILHQVWIDNPSYVEDCLWEGDEMLELDRLLDGEWDDTFKFQSKEDSINYHSNELRVTTLFRVKDLTREDLEHEW